jgi:glycerate kinase
VRIVAATDKFRGTATAAEVVAAISAACWELGHDCVEIPLADGGEGTLEVFGGANRTSKVTGPLGDPVDCEWRLSGGLAVIESARASGLLLAGGADGNDPIAASTLGVGELLDEAITRGARRVIVGVGGSATTDGGMGALSALGGPHRLRGIDVRVACDVRTRFTDAAQVFAPQKGASPAQVEWLTVRLEQLATRYRETYGVDVKKIEGSGAAGGLAGGLAALGAKLEPGFELISDELEVYDQVVGANLIITGEGRLDRASFDGKVVGGMCELGTELAIPVAIVAGEIDRTEVVPEVGRAMVSLVERFNAERAVRETRMCVEEITGELIEFALRRA